MTRDEGLHHHTAPAGRHVIRSEIDRVVESMRAVEAFARQRPQILADEIRANEASEQRRVGGDDQLMTEPRAQPEAGNAEDSNLVAHPTIEQIAGALGAAPGNPMPRGV